MNTSQPTIEEINGYKVVITNVEKHSDLANNQTVLKVDYSFMDSTDKLLDERSEAFAMDTDGEVIKEAVTRALQAYVADAKSAIENAKANAEQEIADKTIEALKGVEIGQ